jgi:hypothetical protein
MKNLKYIALLLLFISSISFADNKSGNLDGTIWEGIGTKTTQATTTATIIAREYGNSAFHKTVLLFIASPVVLTLDGTTDIYGGVGITTTTAVYTFPKGAIQIIGADVNGTLTCGVTGTIVNAYTGYVALGTTTSAAGATLTGTAVNILAATAISAGGANKIAPVRAFSLANVVPYNGTGTAMPMFLNFLITYAATYTSGTCTFTGTTTVTWSNLTNN